MKTSSLLFAVAVAITVVPSGSVFAQQYDQIYGSKGTPTNGTITKMTPSEVTINVSNVERPFPVNEIKRIVFANEPLELGRARDAILAERIEDAAADLAQIDVSNLRDVVKQEVEYYRAYATGKLALAGKGDKRAAVGSLRSFVESNPGSYHYFEANELIGDLAVSLGIYNAAAEYYAKVGQAPWVDYKMRAAVLEGRALLAQDKYAEALQKFEAVGKAEVTGIDALKQKAFANVGRATCLAQTGKPQDGIQILENIIKTENPSDTQLFARVYNALGACYQKANQTKEALMAYLHVDILFYGDAEAHAEALYQLSKLWNAVNRSDRAVESREMLRNRYAGSVWASKT